MNICDPRTEANIATLLPVVQAAARKFMAVAGPAMAEQGLILRIIEGTRTYAQQDYLYQQGRTRPGPIVTNARGGYSLHNFGIAWDVGLFRGSEYIPENPGYDACGRIGESQDLTWGGHWNSMPDTPHFQYRTNLTLAEMQALHAAGKPVL